MWVCNIPEIVYAGVSDIPFQDGSPLQLMIVLLGQWYELLFQSKAIKQISGLPSYAHLQGLQNFAVTSIVHNLAGSSLEIFFSSLNPPEGQQMPGYFSHYTVVPRSWLFEGSKFYSADYSDCPSSPISKCSYIPVAFVFHYSRASGCF